MLGCSLILVWCLLIWLSCFRVIYEHKGDINWAVGMLCQSYRQFGFAILVLDIPYNEV